MTSQASASMSPAGGTPPTREAAMRHARRLVDDHGLGDWRVEWGHATRTWGQCLYVTRTIRLSWPITRLNGIDGLTDTVLHEVAHALAGPGTGHGPVWQEWCRAVGTDPSRCWDAATTNAPPARWHGTCPACGRIVERQRLTRKARRGCCPRCHREHDRYVLLEWTRRH